MVPMISARPVNPYMVEGAKLIACEIAAELGRAPDVLMAPVGGGGLVGGLWKGSTELAAIGVVCGTPVIHGVQKGAYFAPIDRQHEQEWQSERFYRPLDGDWAWSSIQASGGTLRRVEDPEIRAAQAILAQEEGIFVEPHGAYVIAGLLAATEAGALDRDALTVCVLTGAGLKDMKAATEMIERHGRPRAVAVDSLAASDIYFEGENAMNDALTSTAVGGGMLA
jgi:threonine synthase